MDDSLQQGIKMYRDGKRDEARKIFIAVVKQSPDNERAWGWMYDVSNVDKERIYCLRQMLRINPKNEKASQLLNQLIAPSLTAAPSFAQESPQSKQVNSPRPKAKNKGFNIWIASAVAVFCVLVCSCFFGIYLMNSGTQTTTNVAEPQLAEPQSAEPQPAEPQSDENLTYLLKMQPLTDKLQVLNEEFRNEMIQFQDNQNLFYDQSWRNQVNSTLDKTLTASNELESIQPVPQQYVKLDNYLDQAASENKMLVSNFRQYLNGNSDDTTYLLKVVDNINRSNTYVDLAAEELNKINNP